MRARPRVRMAAIAMADDDTSEAAGGGSDIPEAPAGGEAEVAGESPDDAVVGERLSPDELRRRIEALLFATAEPLSARSLARSAGATVAEVRGALAELGDFYSQSGRAFQLLEIAGGWQLLTRPEYGFVVAARKDEQPHRLSAAALEVLAVVAYEQPVTRLEVESIRGVASGPVIRTLIERGLVKVLGRSEQLGNPLLYGTTDRFLEVFGLASIKDLPHPEETSQ